MDHTNRELRRRRDQGEDAFAHGSVRQSLPTERSRWKAAPTTGPRTFWRYESDELQSTRNCATPCAPVAVEHKPKQIPEGRLRLWGGLEKGAEDAAGLGRRFIRKEKPLKG